MALLLLIIVLLCCKFSTSSRKLSLLDILEDELMHKLYGTNITSKWIDIIVGEETWNAHYICSNMDSPINKDKKIMLLLHGYGTSSVLAWRGTIPQLVDKYRIVAIDMPGFGRSTLPASFFSIRAESEIINKYCEFYSKIMDNLNISQPYVVAHSFGGFLFTHCASRFPHRISKLLLADVPGFFPTNGGWDFAWATFFILGLPHVPLRLLGSWSRSLADSLLYAAGIEIDSIYLDYWFEFQLGEKMRSETISNMFLKHRVVYTTASSLALVPLFLIRSSGVPVTTVYGESDPITPPHQGQLLWELAGVPTLLVTGAGHVPYMHNGGVDFVKTILLVDHEYLCSSDSDSDSDSDSGSCSSTTTETFPLSLPQAAATTTGTATISDQHQRKLVAIACCLKQSEPAWTAYPCLPSVYLSNWMLERLYSFLRKTVNECLVTEGKTLDDHSGSTGSSSGESLSADRAFSCPNLDLPPQHPLFD